MDSSSSSKSPGLKLPYKKGNIIELDNASFTLGHLLGKGTYGEVRSATKVDDGTLVAVKIERRRSKSRRKMSSLQLEANVYQMLKTDTVGTGFAKFYGIVTLESPHAKRVDSVMVLELLGPDLEECLIKCNGKFSATTVLQIATQLMDRFQALHEAEIVLRDVKPENFLMGLSNGPNAQVVHLVDFGLAKKFTGSDGKHLPETYGHGSTGTGRFMSLYAHQGIEQSRRDDMLAIGYMFAYLLRGSLPWQGMSRKLKKKNKRSVPHRVLLGEIRKVKESTRVQELCDGFPKVFATYLRSCRELDYDERPHYDIYKGWFCEALSSHDIKEVAYDWEETTSKEATLNARDSKTESETFNSISNLRSEEVQEDSSFDGEESPLA